jgi:hypothetical protein
MEQDYHEMLSTMQDMREVIAWQKKELLRLEEAL